MLIPLYQKNCFDSAEKTRKRVWRSNWWHWVTWRNFLSAYSGKFLFRLRRCYMIWKMATSDTCSPSPGNKQPAPYTSFSKSLRLCRAASALSRRQEIDSIRDFKSGLSQQSINSFVRYLRYSSLSIPNGLCHCSNRCPMRSACCSAHFCFSFSLAAIPLLAPKIHKLYY